MVAVVVALGGGGVVVLVALLFCNSDSNSEGMLDFCFEKIKQKTHSRPMHDKESRKVYSLHVLVPS